MSSTKKKKPKFLYSEEDMIRAIDAVKQGESGFAASKRFDVPRSTLMNKVQGKSPVERKMGPAPIFGEKGEEMLVNWVKALAVKGFPVWKGDIIRSVGQIIKDLNLPNNFVDGLPGKKWLKLFLNRHPYVVSRTVEKLTRSRARVTEAGIRGWFQEVEEYLEKEGWMSILENPSRIFNLDETAFELCPKSDKVLGIRGQKNVYEMVHGSEKESVTLLTNVSADGKLAPSMVVFPGQRLPQGSKTSVPDDWAIAKSEKGWMNGEICYEYIANIFFKWLEQEKVTFPVILFLDGHASHLTYHLSKFCAEHEIILIALHPNSTHLLQPLDVAVFRPLKHGWAKAVHDWKVTHYSGTLTKYNFAFLVKKAMDKTVNERIIENGFRRCGLYPWDSNAVDYTKVDILNAEVTQKVQPTSTKSLPIPDKRTGKLNDAQQFIEHLETFIEEDTLKQFKDTYSKFTPIWLGEERSQDLYVVWKKANDTLQTTLPVQKEKNQDTAVINKTLGDNSTLPIQTDKNDLDVGLDSLHVQTPLQNLEPQPSTSASVQECLPVQSPTHTPQKLLKTLSPGTNGEGVPSPFKRHLFWPGTPKKSTKKRRLVKLPCVVSSKQWQLVEENKRIEKEKKEKEKEERKRKRELAKKEKTHKKTSGKKTGNKSASLINDIEEDWICHICKGRYSSELIRNCRRKWVECDDCGKQYHFKCIPKTHLNEYGLDNVDDSDDDELAFICHVCAAGDDSELGESFSEEDEDL